MISDKSIQDFVKDYVKSVSYGKYKVKEVIITHIERISGFDFIVVDYKVSIYQHPDFRWSRIEEPFTPNNFTLLKSKITLDLKNYQTKRALLIDDILD